MDKKNKNPHDILLKITQLVPWSWQYKDVEV